MKEGTSTEIKHQTRIPKSIILFVILTLPIWLFWYGALTKQAPIEVYLIFIPISYYAIIFLAPYIGIPWLVVVICLVTYQITGEVRKRRVLRRTRSTKEARAAKADGPKRLEHR